MSAAVGMVEVLGYPSVLAVSDAMVKAGRVTLVHCEKITRAYWTVIVRGNISEVQVAVEAGIQAVDRVDGGKLLSWHIIARPHENLDYVLPIGYTPAVEQFRN